MEDAKRGCRTSRQNEIECMRKSSLGDYASVAISHEAVPEGSLAASENAKRI